MRSLLNVHRKFASIIGVLTIVTAHTAAQNPPVPTNEYRVTNITSKMISDKAILFTYSGYTNSVDKEFRSYYGSPPNLIYQIKPWMELLLGLVIVYNDNRRTNDSWEFRPIGGIKFYVPNDKKVNIYSLTRFEYRMIVQDDQWQKIPRLRNRFGIEFPLARGEKSWTLKTFYALADVEPIYRLDTNRLQVLRLRGGIGYIYSKLWRAEVIYHHETSGTSQQPYDHTGNIWRLNIKVNIPRRAKNYTRDIDID